MAKKSKAARTNETVKSQIGLFGGLPSPSPEFFYKRFKKTLQEENNKIKILQAGYLQEF